MFYGNDPRPGDNQEHPIKVEKDEYVVNRNAARKHRKLLDYINFVDEPRYDNKEMAHSSIDEAISLNTLSGMQEGGFAESPELAAMLEAEAKKNPEWTKALASVSDLPDIRSSLTDVQRAAGEKGSGMTTSIINTLDPETQAMFVDYMEGTDKKGFEESYIRTPEGKMFTGGRQYHGGLTAPIKNLYSRLRGPREVESIPSQYMLPGGMQEGGSVPMFNPMSSHGAIDAIMLMERLKQG